MFNEEIDIVAEGDSEALIRSEKLLRISQVLGRVPISKSGWWDGVKTGKYPKGIKISPRVTVWKSSSIDSLIQSLSA